MKGGSDSRGAKWCFAHTRERGALPGQQLSHRVLVLVVVGVGRGCRTVAGRLPRGLASLASRCSLVVGAAAATGAAGKDLSDETCPPQGSVERAPSE